VRLTYRRALAAALFLTLSVGSSVAGAVSGPGANENSKLVYTEEIVATDLSFAFDEGSQKRFPSVDYQLVVTVTVMRFCNGQGLGSQQTETPTVTIAPNEEGRAVGAFTVDSGTTDTICACGCGAGSLAIDYTDMTLTNLTGGHVYRLDPISQTFTT
jgi:hypothetical protein